MQKWRAKVLTVVTLGMCSYSTSFNAVAAGDGAPDETVVQHVLRNSAGLTAEETRQNFDRGDDGRTTPMKICGAYRWAVQDIRLNRAFLRARTMAKHAGYEQALVKAQRAWLAYRDSQCDVEGVSAAKGGTEEGLYVLSCKEELTKLQADRLEAQDNQH